MARPEVGNLLRHIHHLAGPCAPAELSDRDLLMRFAGGREEAAFAALVQRHGPLVLNVCRRLLRQEQDAEDVFQATFLVLARKAGSVRWRDSVAPWLYAVAHRLALKARAEAIHCRLQEREAAQERSTTTAEDLNWREAVAILEEELGRLPERYRAPLLLCCWEGKARDEAARLLGWTVGTVKGRLERGRELLRQRLARRGVALSAGLLAVGLARGGVPAALAGATVRLATLVASGAAGMIPPAVAALAEAALVSAKAKVAGVLLAVALAAAVAGAWAHQAWTARPVDQAQADETPAPQADERRPAAPPAPVVKAPEDKPPPDEKPPVPLPWPRADRDGDALPAGVARRFGTTRLRQTDAVRLVAFSPDGKMLASAGEKTYLWDAATGMELHRIESAALSLAFSPDGETLAEVGTSPRVRNIVFWNTKTGARLKEPELYSPQKSQRLSFSPDGRRLWAVYPGGAEAWDSVRGERKFHMRFAGELRDAFAIAPGAGPKSSTMTVATPTGLHCFDANGKIGSVLEKKDGAEFTSLTSGYDLLAAGTAAGDIRLWEGDGERLPKLLHTWREAGGAITALAFSMTGGALRLTGVGAGAAGMEVYTWDPEKGNRLTRVGLEGTPTSRPGRDLPKVVMAGGKRVRVMGLPTVVLSPNGQRVAVVDEADQRVRLWDTATGKELFVKAGHERGVRQAAFLSDGKTIVSVADDGVLLWPAGSDERPRRLAASRCRGVTAISPDGKAVAMADSVGRIEVWDTTTDKLLREIDAGEPVRSLAFAPDGRSLAFVSARTYLMLLRDGSIRPLGDEIIPTAAIAFSPDGKLLATDERKGEGDSIVLWDVATGKKLRTLAGPPRSWFDSLAFDPEGRMLAVAGQWSNTVTLYDVATGRELRRYRRPGATIHSLAFVREGRLLVTAGEDGLTLWATATGAEVLHLTGHTGAVNSVAPSPDGNRLVTGGADTTVLLWDLAAAWKETTPQPPKGKKPPTPEELWRDLGRDGGAAYRALWALAADRDKALSLVKTDLAPGSAIRDEMGLLLADLDSADPKVRERALEGMLRMGLQAEATLRKALGAAKSEKLQARLRAILAQLEGEGVLTPDDDALYAGRVVALLELIGTAEARKRLDALARDGRTWALRQEAMAVLGRQPVP